MACKGTCIIIPLSFYVPYNNYIIAIYTNQLCLLTLRDRMTCKIYINAINKSCLQETVLFMCSEELLRGWTHAPPHTCVHILGHAHTHRHTCTHMYAYAHSHMYALCLSLSHTQTHTHYTYICNAIGLGVTMYFKFRIPHSYFIITTKR